MKDSNSDGLDEILIPDDNCLKVPGEHCGSCHADFEDDGYLDMNCCDHQKWREETKKKLTAYINEVETKQKQEAVTKNKSFCGCSMCEYHTTAYEVNNEMETKAKKLMGEG